MMLWLSTDQYLSPAGRVEGEQCGPSGPGREAQSTSPTGSLAGLRSAELLRIDILSLGEGGGGRWGEMRGEGGGGGGGEIGVGVILNITLGGRNVFALELL